MDRKIIILILVVASTIAQNIPAGTLAKTPKHRLFLCFLDRQELGSGANSAKRPVEFRGNQYFGQQFIAHKARTDQIISLGITFQEESHDEKFFEIQKLGPHIVAQNHQKIGPIIMVSIHIKPLVKHPEPLPELLESLFRKLNGLELDGNKKCSTISRHGLKKYFPFFCVNGQNK